MVNSKSMPLDFLQRNPTSVSELEYAGSVQEAFFSNSLVLAAAVVLYYEYFLTFSLEVDRIWWQRSFTWANFFFYLNRYFALLGQPPIVIQHFSLALSYASAANPACHHLLLYHELLMFIIQASIAAILIMRTYALYNRSHVVLCILCAPVLLGTAVSIWAFVTPKTLQGYSSAPIPGCQLAYHPTSAARIAMAFAALLVFDMVVFSLTVARAFTIRKVKKSGWIGWVRSIGWTKERSLLTVLLRDGAIYFLVMAAANTITITMFFFANPNIRGGNTTLLNVISSIMASRLMLNIRNPSLASPSSRTKASTGIQARSHYLTTVVILDESLTRVESLEGTDVESKEISV